MFSDTAAVGYYGRVNNPDEVYPEFDADQVVATGRLVLMASVAEAEIGFLVAALADGKPREQWWNSGNTLADVVRKLAKQRPDLAEHLNVIADEQEELSKFRNGIVHGEVILAGTKFAFISKRATWKESQDARTAFLAEHPMSEDAYEMHMMMNASVSLEDYRLVTEDYLALFEKVVGLLDREAPDDGVASRRQRLTDLRKRADDEGWEIPSW